MNDTLDQRPSVTVAPSCPVCGDRIVCAITRQTGPVNHTLVLYMDTTEFELHVTLHHGGGNTQPGGGPLDPEVDQD
jgi:hypothetical protein